MTDDRHPNVGEGIDWYALLLFTIFLAFALSNVLAWSGALPIPIEVVVGLGVLALVAMIPIFQGKR